MHSNWRFNSYVFSSFDWFRQLIGPSLYQSIEGFKICRSILWKQTKKKREGKKTNILNINTTRNPFTDIFKYDDGKCSHISRPIVIGLYKYSRYSFSLSFSSAKCTLLCNTIACPYSIESHAHCTFTLSIPCVWLENEIIIMMKMKMNITITNGTVFHSVLLYITHWWRRCRRRWCSSRRRWFTFD